MQSSFSVSLTTWANITIRDSYSEAIDIGKKLLMRSEPKKKIEYVVAIEPSTAIAIQTDNQ